MRYKDDTTRGRNSVRVGAVRLRGGTEQHDTTRVRGRMRYKDDTTRDRNSVRVEAVRLRGETEQHDTVNLTLQMPDARPSLRVRKKAALKGSQKSYTISYA